MHHNYVGKLVKINLFDKMHLNMNKNDILNSIKPTINEIVNMFQVNNQWRAKSN